MFPHREPVSDNNNTNNKINSEESFLSRHSGKIAIAALLISGSVFYSYYKTGRNRNEMEDLLTESSQLEPYEIQELRNANNFIGLQEYEAIVAHISEAFPVAATYSEIVGLLEHEELLPNTIACGYILDRLVISYVFNHYDCNNTDTYTSTASYKDVKIPVQFFLVVLNLFVSSSVSAEERLKGLSQLVTKGMTVTLLDHLLESYQIPTEKQVVEVGGEWFLKTFRQKSSLEMITSKEEEGKKTIEESSHLCKGEEELMKLLFSKKICLWGECYRQ